jgi:hypothetical protein
MKETLTVRAGMSDALRRGDEVLRQYQTLLEVGTDYDVALHEVMKRVAFVVDEVRHRVRFYGVSEPTKAQLIMNAERLLKAGQINPWPELVTQTLSVSTGNSSAAVALE